MALRNVCRGLYLRRFRFRRRKKSRRAFAIAFSRLRSLSVIGGLRVCELVNSRKYLEISFYLRGQILVTILPAR
jgi:hypothetical protein